MEFVSTLPKFDWVKAETVEIGVKKGDLGVEAIHFPGGEGEHLGPEGCEELCLLWQELETLAAIRMGPNSLDDEAMANLAQLLQHNDAILYFSLYSNPLAKGGVQAVCQAIAISKTLVGLQLQDCKIDDEMAALLASELEHGNRSLLQIDLSNNFIRSKGAQAFAKAIKVNDVLTTLSLAANGIEEGGMEALASALEVNFTLCICDVSENKQSFAVTDKISALCKKNTDALWDAVVYCNANVKQGPLRKAKICFVGRHASGKTSLVNALRGQPFREHYTPTEGAKVTQVLTRLRGEMWHGIARLPTSEFGYQFLSRFVNIKLDEKVEMIEKEEKKEIGFAGLKKRGNRRGSIQQRRASVTGKRRASVTAGGLGLEDNRTSMRNSVTNRQSRRGSVAMSVLNAVLGEPGASNGRRGSIKEILTKVVHPFNRKKNDLLDDKEYEFYSDKERKPGETTLNYSPEDLDALFDVHVLAKARRERDNLGFNLMELSGNRAFYTIHHAFLTRQSVYVLLFNMEKLANKGEPEGRLEEIKYINYWLKVIRYHSPEASLMVIGTHSGDVPKDYYGAVEGDISKLVFPELHRAHAKRKQQLKLNKAVDAANEFAKQLEEENEGDDFVHKKTKLIVNEADRRLFFPVELSKGKGVSNVRLALDKAAKDQKYYGQQIPVRWLKFLDALRRDSPNYFCPAARVKALAFQTLEDHEGEMKEALELFHELGYIVHITEIEQLKDIVITDTLSFYRIIFRLIFTEDMSLFDFEDAKKQGFSDDLQETLKTGMVSEALLDYLWKDEMNLVESVGEAEVKKGRQFFLEYTQLTLVLAQYKFGGDKGRYIIPSMIPFDHDLVKETKEKFGDGLNLRCKFKFSGYLTLGVFERLLCLCIQYSGNQSQSLEPVLAMGWTQMSFGMAYVFRLERLPDDIILHVIESKKKKAYKLVENFEKMFDRLRQILGKGFMWSTTLEDGEENFIPYAAAKEKKLKGWFS